MTKELIVEIKRWLDDGVLNRKVYQKLTPLDERSEAEASEYKYSDVFLCDIKVGDILMIEDEEVLPADCILLKGNN